MIFKEIIIVEGNEMNKKMLALKILLSSLVVLLIALIALEIKCSELHSDNDNGNGLLFAVAILLNAIPMIAMIVLGAVTAVLSILLWAGKQKLSVIICALIVLCLLTPFVGFSLFVDITALGAFIEVPVMAAVVFAVNIAALVTCSIVIRRERGQNKTSPND